MAKQKQNEHVENDGTYVVPKNRKKNILAFILCVLVALLIWIYASNMEDKEKLENGEDSSAVAVTDVSDTHVL